MTQLTTSFTGKPLPDWAGFHRTATALGVAEYRMERHLSGLDEPEYPVLNRDWAKQRRYERCRRNLDSAKS